MKTDYEERKQNRIERMKELSEKNKQLSLQFWKSSHKIIDMIPMGQPILVGHHSEKRHRRDLERSDSYIRKSIEADEKAKHYTSRVAHAESNRDISSDDPQAIEKLKEKIKALEEAQEMMKKVNSIHAKFLKNPAILETADLSDKMKEIIQNYKPGYSWEKHPFAPFQISNNNANITRNKKRLAELERQSQETTTEIEENGIKIIDNVEDNRVQIFFPGIPSEAIRTHLKSRGFHWSKFNDCWMRFRSYAAMYEAKKVLTMEVKQ
jgi:hypothetical protein